MGIFVSSDDLSVFFSERGSLGQDPGDHGDDTGGRRD